MTMIWDERTERVATKGDIMDLVRYKAQQFTKKEDYSLSDVERFCSQIGELGKHLK